MMFNLESDVVESVKELILSPCSTKITSTTPKQDQTVGMGQNPSGLDR